MRYRQIPLIQFTNALGDIKTIREQRLEIVGDIVSVFPKAAEQDLDDIGVKVFGKNSEFITYRLRDQNRVKLLANNFDESALKSVEVGDNF